MDGPPPNTDLSFDLDCSDNVFDTLVPVDMPAGETRVTEDFSGIPTGVTCKVTEQNLPPGWRLIRITPNKVVVKNSPSTITVTNERMRGTPQIRTSTSQLRVKPGQPFYDRVHVRGIVGGHGVIATARLYGPFTSRAAAVCRLRGWREA